VCCASAGTCARRRMGAGKREGGRRGKDPLRTNLNLKPQTHRELSEGKLGHGVIPLTTLPIQGEGLWLRMEGISRARVLLNPAVVWAGGPAVVGRRCK